MIKVRNLKKVYGNNCAVKNLSMDIEPGHIYGLLGPNGAGKSTTMNIITGCLAATSGDVTVCDFDIFDKAAAAKACIGYLPEQPPLYLDMTVFEYLDFVGEAKKIKKQDRLVQINDIMEQTMLTEVKDRLIKNLSKGFKQRVGIAQAILGYPPIIILDEPTVGLDPKQILIIRDLIRSLKEKHTVILSSHIMQEIVAVCDYIIIIADGEIVASGSQQELVDMYTNDTAITLRTKADAERAAEILRDMDSCDGIEVLSDSADGGFTVLEISVANDAVAEDVSEKLFFAFSSAGVAITELKINKTELEDVFIRLTAKTDEFAEIDDSEDVDDEEAVDGEEDTELFETDETNTEEVCEDESDL